MRFNDKRWHFSENSDIAIGIIKPAFYHEVDTLDKTDIIDTSKYVLFNPQSLNRHIEWYTEDLNKQLKAPFRDMELVAIGFPSGIGNYNNPQTTVSKFFKTSSDMIDLETKNPFFIIDDPSVDGLSGSPTFEVHSIFTLDSLREGIRRYSGYCVGMINGTFNDANGGKFTSVIPSKLILDEIEIAKNEIQIRDYYYSNGNIWQETVIEKGKIMEVLFNLDKNGKEQFKGTLKAGNGTIRYYHEDGDLFYDAIIENGRIIKNTPIKEKK